MASRDRNVITINVGGEKIIQVKPELFSVVGDNMFASMCSDRWQNSIDVNGHMFVDYSPQIFLPLIEFLRFARDSAPDMPVPVQIHDDLRRPWICMMLASSFHPKVFRRAGTKIRELQSCGCDNRFLCEAGFTLAEMGHQLGEAEGWGGISSLPELRAQVSLRELKEAGYPLSELQSVGYTAQELRLEGFTPQEFLDVGHTIQALIEIGFSAQQLTQAGLTLQQLFIGGLNFYRAGLPLQELLDGGLTFLQLEQAGFTPREFLDGGFTGQQLRQAGFTCRALRDGGLTARQLQDLRTAGFTPREFLDGGFTVQQFLGWWIYGSTVAAGRIHMPGFARRWADGPAAQRCSRVYTPRVLGWWIYGSTVAAGRIHMPGFARRWADGPAAHRC
ncbi:unnamed protein product [Effrenium voratum]|nr:unnamed protein product [Effrenium voratum]